MQTHQGTGKRQRPIFRPDSRHRKRGPTTKAEALKTKARLHSNRLYHSLARAQKRLDDIEASKTAGASSSIITYSEEEVEEMEGVIGEITKELAELKAVLKHDELEYERNRLAVAHFRSKYRELADLRQQRNKLQVEVQQVKAQLETERADHGPGSPRMPGAFMVLQD